MNPFMQDQPTSMVDELEVSRHTSIKKLEDAEALARKDLVNLTLLHKVYSNLVIPNTFWQFNGD